MENLTEYLDLVTVLVAAVSAAIPTIVGWWKKQKDAKTLGEHIVAIDYLEAAIGEGGTVNEVVKRVAALKNKVIEDRLTKNNAKVIEIEIESQ